MINADKLWTPFSVRLRSRLLLFIIVALFEAADFAIIIALCVWHQYKMNMYTYWSFTILTAFYALLLVSIVVERLFFTLTVLFALPVVLGNVVFVAIAIIIIIANNAEAYRKGSVCANPPGDMSLESLHTGDWIVHGLPVFGVMVVLLCGLEFFSQNIIAKQLKAWNAALQWLYWLFWMLGPLALITLYQLIFDVNKLYPTSFSVAERTAILASVVLIWQFLTWLIFTQVSQYQQIHAHSVPSLHNLVEHRPAHFEPSADDEVIQHVTIGDSFVYTL